jgi:hypothetical protein
MRVYSRDLFAARTKGLQETGAMNRAPTIFGVGKFHPT